MTHKRLDEIKARIAQATPGPRTQIAIQRLIYLRGLCQKEYEKCEKVDCVTTEESIAMFQRATHFRSDLERVVKALEEANKALEESCICMENWQCRACEGRERIDKILDGE